MPVSLFCARGLTRVSIVGHPCFSLAHRCSMSTKLHYEKHTIESYENAFFYETGDYTSNLCQLVQKRLSLNDRTKKRTIVDIGGGTGNFSSKMITSVDAECIVVDPFLEHTNSSDENGRVTFQRTAAETFMEKATDRQQWRKEGFHQVLLKEVVHHFAANDRPRIFRGIFEDIISIDDDEIQEIPSLLIITRPKIDIDYPLWEEAKVVWAKNQPSVDDLAADLKSAGFSNVAHSIEPYPCVIELERWREMVKSRFWSTFAEFSDAELHTACAKMGEREQHRIKNGRIHFEDRLLFMTAKKSE